MTNDGATILSLLDIEHPAGKILVDLAQQQDKEVHLTISLSSIDADRCYLVDRLAMVPPQLSSLPLSCSGEVTS